MRDINPAVQAASEYIVREIYEDDPTLSEEFMEIIQVHAACTLDWLLTCWRSEGPDVENMGRTFIAAAIETKAHLENLVRFDE